MLLSPHLPPFADRFHCVAREASDREMISLRNDCPLRPVAGGDLMPPWFAAVTAPAFLAGSTVLAALCRPAERIEKWGLAFVDPSDQEQAA